MKLIKILTSCAIAFALCACGGGGGNPGTNTSGSGGSGSGGTTTSPAIVLSIVDSSNTVVVNNSISSGALFYAQATLTDAKGVAVANKLVTFTADASLATLGQNGALTDANGVVKVQISPTSLSSTGASKLSVASTVGTDSVSASLDFQVAAANVSVTNFVAASTSINALQTTGVSVEGRINGALAGNGQVTVNFSAACGTFSPASAITNSSGIAKSTYQSAVTCSGPVVLTASAANLVSAPISTTVNVAAALPANVIFVGASAPLMVVSTTTGGVKQSSLKYQVLDSSGAGMAGQQITVVLAGAAKDAGVKFFTGGVATAADQVLTTDASGFAQVTVTSGSLPTPVIATASLTSALSVQASSLGVAVTTGRATQNSASLSAESLSIEGYNIDGETTKITMRVADRQGNPVPVGTVVNFVASYGAVQGSCQIDAASQCSVTYTSQGARPPGDASVPQNKGRAVIIAYLDGEESFIDQNGDNIWQAGEPFYDVGLLYRDDNESKTYSAANEQSYPGGMTGATNCYTNGLADPAASANFYYPSAANTCDGTWSSSIRVRKQIVITLATQQAQITLVNTHTASGFTVRVSDLNGNSMPTGTTVAASVLTNGATCTVKNTSPNKVSNSPDSDLHVVTLDEAADCVTVKVGVTVTSPKGVSTLASF